jgi:hypothetical protein
LRRALATARPVTIHPCRHLLPPGGGILGGQEEISLRQCGTPGSFQIGRIRSTGRSRSSIGPPFLLPRQKLRPAVLGLRIDDTWRTGLAARFRVKSCRHESDRGRMECACPLRFRPVLARNPLLSEKSAGATARAVAGTRDFATQAGGMLTSRYLRMTIHSGGLVRSQ